MGWFTRLTTFANSIRNNNCDLLDDEVDSIKTTLDVLKYAYVPLTINVGAAANYDPATYGVGVSVIAKGKMSYPPGYQFDTGVQLIVMNYPMPADAATSTTCSLILDCYVSSADGNDIKMNMLSRANVVGTAIDIVTTPTSSSNTITTSGSYANFKPFTLTFTTVAVSAGNKLEIYVYRDTDDAADTSAAAIVVTNVTLKYTRTA